jgi:hypothetical protein
MAETVEIGIALVDTAYILPKTIKNPKRDLKIANKEAKLHAVGNNLGGGSAGGRGMLLLRDS